MIIKADKTGTVEQFNELIDTMSHNDDVRSILVLACDENGFTPDNVNQKLKSLSKPIFGGIFPEIIYGKDKLSKGCIVAGLFEDAQVQTISRLSDMEIDYESQIDESLSTGDTKTMLVFVDGFAKRIGAVIDSLFNVFGLEFNYIGGGAGSLSLKQKPCLFTNEGLIQDSMILIMLNMESGVGVCHGWNEVAGPYKVTESDQNIIQTLDWKPAFQVYREVVEQHSQMTFTDDNFFDIAKSYPFGINKLGTEKIVRDPLMAGENDSLVCVGEVPQESYVHILTGDVDSLVNAAHTALTLSENTFNTECEKKTILFIDCISRVLFLGDEFIRELEAVSHNDIPLIGALTIGEIANSQKDYLEFYNKTSVVGVLAE
ncbi:MAG: FIST C-terminal domain-containing protein [Sedimentisphaerales bacterium]|nr:FIST C-terminal domain-containing protein [Sedimentisphaerales bacterium]